MKTSDLIRAIEHAIVVCIIRGEELEEREKTQNRNKMGSLAAVTGRQWNVNCSHLGTLKRYLRGLKKINANT